LAQISALTVAPGRAEPSRINESEGSCRTAAGHR